MSFLYTWSNPAGSFRSNHTWNCSIQEMLILLNIIKKTHPQHQYSKTATYIVSNFNLILYIYIHIYIYIYTQTKMKVLLHSQIVTLFLDSQKQKPNDSKHWLWSL